MKLYLDFFSKNRECIEDITRVYNIKSIGELNLKDNKLRLIYIVTPEFFLDGSLESLAEDLKGVARLE